MFKRLRQLREKEDDKGSGGAPPKDEVPPPAKKDEQPPKREELPAPKPKGGDDAPANTSDALSAHDRRLKLLEDRGGAGGIGAGAVVGIVLLAVTVGALIYLGARFLLSTFLEE